MTQCFETYKQKVWNDEETDRYMQTDKIIKNPRVRLLGHTGQIMETDINAYLHINHAQYYSKLYIDITNVLTQINS